MKEGPFAIEWAEGGLPIAIQQFAFRYENGKLDILTGEMLASQGKEVGSDLTHCFVGWAAKTPILLCGPVVDESKLMGWSAIARSIQSKSRLIRFNINRLASLKMEWKSLNLQLSEIARARKSIFQEKELVHLLSPMEPLFSLARPRSETLSETKALRELMKLINALSWVRYCYFFNDLLESAFFEFKYDAVDTYTLQRYIKDFEHEVGNPLLERTSARLTDLEASLLTRDGQNQLSYQETLKLEKEIVLARGEIRGMVSAHYDALKEIVRIIRIIESSHPDLKRVKISAQILKGLLDFEAGPPESKPLPFAGEQILIQLINDSFGVLSGICADFGVERTALAFTVRVSALWLALESSPEEVIDLAVNWEETTQKLHQAACERGIARFEEWRAEVQSPQFAKRADLLLKFWEFFLLNLKHLFVPLTGLAPVDFSIRESDRPYFNHELLLLIPPFAIRKGKPMPPSFVTYDAESLLPVSLTQEGMRLLNLMS